MVDSNEDARGRRRSGRRLAEALRRLPLFPLPNVVLFPHALLPPAHLRGALPGDDPRHPRRARASLAVSLIAADAARARRAPAGRSRSPAWARW